MPLKPGNGTSTKPRRRTGVHAFWNGSKYRLVLPTEEELRREIEREHTAHDDHTLRKQCDEEERDERQ